MGYDFLSIILDYKRKSGANKIVQVVENTERVQGPKFVLLYPLPPPLILLRIPLFKIKNKRQFNILDLNSCLQATT